MAPVTSGHLFQKVERGLQGRLRPLIRLPSAVAAASASATSSEIISAASALPKLIEGPTVPDDVQTPEDFFAGRYLQRQAFDRGLAGVDADQ